jgi:hypothetical protein
VPISRVRDMVMLVVWGSACFLVRGFRDERIRETKVVLLVKIGSKYLTVSRNFGESGMK